MDGWMDDICTFIGNPSAVKLKSVAHFYLFTPSLPHSLPHSLTPLSGTQSVIQLLVCLSGFDCMDVCDVEEGI